MHTYIGTTHTDTPTSFFIGWGNNFRFVTCNPVISYVEISNRILEVHKSLHMWKTYRCYNKKVSCRRLSKNSIDANVYWQQSKFCFFLEWKVSYTAQAKTKRDGCELEGGPRRGENPGEPPKQGGRHFLHHMDYYGSCISAKQNTFYYTHPTMKSMCKCFSCHVTSVRWGGWSWKTTEMIRVKQQDRVAGVEQGSSAMVSRERVWVHLLQRIDTTWTFSSQRAAKEIWAAPWGTDPAPKSKQDGPGDALKAEGDQSHDGVGVYNSNTKIQNLMPYLTQFSPQERGGIKQKGITAIGHITLYTCV